MRGPYFEDLEPGRSFQSDGMTVSDGHAAWFQSLAGDRNPVHLDDRIARRVGLARAPLSTALLAHVAIGHSTAATHEVVANLFYSNVLFARPALPGVTLMTTTTVLARAEASARPDREPRGKVLLGITTVDEEGRSIVEMTRTALVRKASRSDTGTHDVVEPAARASDEVIAAVHEWMPLASAMSPLPPAWRSAAVGPDDLAEPVVGALELVRITGNIAKAHRDFRFGQNERRLVYGGHTLSIAQAALSRSIDGDHIVVGWQGCTHPAPVFEEDLLGTTVTGYRELGGSASGELTRFETASHTGERDEQHEVQRWTPLVLSAATGLS